ncbi:MAG: response regulator [Chitinophagaceae bacterium]
MKCILIIEDNTAIRENTSEILELRKYKVLAAEEGQKGFKLAKEFLPDLILCDIMMPDTDGSLFFRLAKADAVTRDIPIVFFSAGSAQHLQVELKKIADGFLKKPFSEEELLSTVLNALLPTEKLLPAQEINTPGITKDGLHVQI